MVDSNSKSRRIFWNLQSETEDELAAVYSSSKYQEIFARFHGCEPANVYGARDGAEYRLPILIRDLAPGVREGFSSYGYGGFSSEHLLTEEDVERFKNWLASRDIVALFIRHTPYSANSRVLPGKYKEFNRWTYSEDLQRDNIVNDQGEILNQRIRWSVNRARKAGLKVESGQLEQCPQELVRDFYRLYTEVMVSKKTGGFYLFPESLFLDHMTILGAHCDLFFIREPTSGRLIAGAMFLTDADRNWVHYHLSAAGIEAMQFQGMDLLMLTAIQKYRERGFKSIHLGGGHELDESDGLSRFKRKYGTKSHKFHVTKLVCDPARYELQRRRETIAAPSHFLIGDARVR